ncbi:MAG: serine hydrolase domain-containing protein [Rikenellaceae bacterium]
MNRKSFAIIIIIVAAVLILAATVGNPLDLFKSGSSNQKRNKLTTLSTLIDNSLSNSEQTKGFDKNIEYFMRRWELKGGSFALMKDDKLIYAKGYGNATDDEKCDVKHLFRVASVSKLLTATAIMKLAEQDKLSLSSQVFGAKGILNDTIFLDLKYKNLEQITVDHLLRHTSGFSSPHGDPAFANYTIARIMDKKLPLTTDDMVLYATQNKLRSRPGGSYDYSNLGYIILGKIVEKASGMSYEGYVQDSILAPIGCYDPSIGRNFSKNRAHNEVNYYEVKEAEPVEAYDGSGRMTMKSNGGNNVTLLGGAGGWVASPVEILRLVASINGEGSKKDILSRESVRKMTRYSKTERPIGWASVKSNGEWLRSGSMAGTSALIKREKSGYTWIFVSNSSTWIGHKFSSNMSTHISRYISNVKQWPDHDLFDKEQIAQLRESQAADKQAQEEETKAGESK